MESSFDNIKNNPVKQFVNFDNEVKAKFISLVSFREINNKNCISVSEIGVITE